jgi:hypothetical protein
MQFLVRYVCSFCLQFEEAHAQLNAMECNIFKRLDSAVTSAVKTKILQLAVEIEALSSELNKQRDDIISEGESSLNSHDSKVKLLPKVKVFNFYCYKYGYRPRPIILYVFFISLCILNQFYCTGMLNDYVMYKSDFALL